MQMRMRILRTFGGRGGCPKWIMRIKKKRRAENPTKKRMEGEEG
jgi:hypothetical protein